MKKTLQIVLLCLSCSAVFAQTNQWTWMKGDNVAPELPVYGTKGIEAAANKPGGRQFATTWMTASGDLWVFGGIGLASFGQGYLNDLWKYSAETGHWTWVSGIAYSNINGTYGTQGVPMAANSPGTRESAVGWTDASGNLWLFGGYGYGNSFNVGQLNDLWKFSPSTGQWTWISGSNDVNAGSTFGIKGTAGSTNMPGARERTLNWKDASGNFWLFGGYGFANGIAGSLNDLWKYNPVSGQWTWVSGGTSTAINGVYGTKGTPGALNNPGGRRGATGWIDHAGNLVLFGGYGYDIGLLGELNDLWSFNPATGLWTWLSGDNVILQQGVYGMQGVEAPANKPGSRENAVSWTDASGNLWLFGGLGFTATNLGNLNDTWRYNLSSGQWTWVSGYNFIDFNGNYGSKGVTSPANMPGTKNGASGTIDANGNFLMFGGMEPLSSYVSYSNSLWSFNPQSLQWTWVSGDSPKSIWGTYGTKGASDSTNKPGARYGATSASDAAGNLWMFGGLGYATFGLGSLSDLWKYVPSTGQWIWAGGDNITYQKGIYGPKLAADPLYHPGSRYGATSWTDASGNFWLFGGYAYIPDSVTLVNDLWKFNALTNQWSWISGDSMLNQKGNYGTKGITSTTTKPGARYNSTSWTDAAGNLWLFGGMGYSASARGSLNDLWKYDIVSSQWTWISGDSSIYKSGVYNGLGITSSGSRPGSRYGSAGWSDNANNLWLFGGDNDTTIVTDYGTYNDLWKYNIPTGQWTWVSGDSTRFQKANYGIPGVSATGNKPGARASAVHFTDPMGNFWLFGGNGVFGDAGFGSYTGYANDLWKYSPSTGQWTWVSGDSTGGNYGRYGNQGMPATTNTPGARYNAIGWTDALGKFWIYGGEGSYSNGAGILNDLWQYSATAVALPVQVSRFTAQKQQESVLLNWTTSQEENSFSFTIERSNALVFDSIGNVRAAGYNSFPSNYSFIDKFPVQGANYYRLRQVDKDGKIIFSNTVKILMDDELARFVILQNPVQNLLQLNVQLPVAQKVEIQVRDQTGNLLISKELMGTRGNSMYGVSVSQLARGTYFIHLQMGNCK